MKVANYFTSDKSCILPLFIDKIKLLIDCLCRLSSWYYKFMICVMKMSKDTADKRRLFVRCMLLLLTIWTKSNSGNSCLTQVWPWFFFFFFYSLEVVCHIYIIRLVKSLWQIGNLTLNVFFQAIFSLDRSESLSWSQLLFIMI